MADGDDMAMQQVLADGSINCTCPDCRRWKEYLRGELSGGPPWPQYEVFTQEAVAGLAEYIW